MNWGTGIVISFILFITMIFIFIYLGSREPSDLVTEDYYAQELAYEDVIRAKNMVSPFADSILLTKAEQSITLVIPTMYVRGAEGTVHFYRPSDAQLDQLYELDTDVQGHQLFDMSRFTSGKYVVKVSWQKNGTSYYWENDLYL
jgi:hypothetical protein